MTDLDSPVSCCRPLGEPSFSHEDAEATAALFRALGDAARVRIVNILATSESPVCACDFTPKLGLTQATVSHHLKRLTDAGLLDREQRGKWAFFSLSPGAAERLADVVRFQEPVA